MTLSGRFTLPAISVMEIELVFVARIAAAGAEHNFPGLLEQSGLFAGSGSDEVGSGREARGSGDAAGKKRPSQQHPQGQESRHRPGEAEEDSTAKK